MCEVNDDHITKTLRRANISEENCKKCSGEKGKIVILLRNDDKPMCKECFIESSVHKFRSEFGKSQIIRQGEKVIVGFSGGQSSYALLEMIKIGLSGSSFRKLRFIPEFIHIKEEGQCTEAVERALKESGFAYRILDEANLVDQRLMQVNALMQQGGLRGGAATAQKNVKLVLLKTVLTQLALAEGFSRVLLATACTRMAIRTLSDIAQACGTGAVNNVEFHDSRFAVSIIQPLRLFSMKELIFFNRFRGVDVAVTTNEETSKPKTFSIDRLTETFISSLTSDFPATIFTINRTAEKTRSEDHGSEARQCGFCKNVFRARVFNRDVASAANAMTVAQQLLRPISLTPQDGEQDYLEEERLCYPCSWLQQEVSIPLIVD